MKVSAVSPAGDCLFIAVGNLVIGVGLSGQGEAKIFRFEAAGEDAVVAIDCSGRYLVGGYNSKHVCCWDLHSAEVLGSCVLKKRPTHVSLGSFREDDIEREAVVAADRGGEVHAMGLPHLRGSLCLAGHTTSVITDLLMAGGRMVTADRDEKIRVARFPQASIIESYCMGHTSVVSSVAAAGPLLASCGWDHRVCLWEAGSGASLGMLQVGPEGPGGEGKDAEAEAMDGKAGGGEAGGEGGEGEEGKEEEEEEEEKAYDEQQAGNYPIKVLVHIVTPSSSSAPQRVLLVLLFRGLPCVKTCLATRASAGEAQPFSFAPLVLWPTAAPPVDALVLPGAAGEAEEVQVAVLLPGPEYLRVVRVPTGKAAASSSLSSSPSSLREELCAATQRALAGLPGGATLVQQSTLADTREGGRPALLKHALDKPFNALTTGVDARPQPGRRGRKRPLDRVERESTI